MSKSRTWTFGAIAAMLVVLIGGWMLGISPIFTQITAADAQTTTIKASNVSTQSQLATLRSQFSKIDTLQRQLDTLRLSIPEAEAASDFLSEVTGVGGSTSVSVQSVTIADAVAFTSPDSTATTPATTGTSTATATPSPAAGTTPAATTPSVTSNGLVIIPVVVTVKGTLAQTQNFVQKIQKGARLFVSSNLTMSTDAGTGVVTAGLIGDIFTLEGSSDGTTSDGSTSTTTATPFPVDTSTPTLTPTPTGTATTSSTKTGGSTGTKKSTPAPTSPSTPVSINPAPGG